MPKRKKNRGSGSLEYDFDILAHQDRKYDLIGDPYDIPIYHNKKKVQDRETAIRKIIEESRIAPVDVGDYDVDYHANEKENFKQKKREFLSNKQQLPAQTQKKKPLPPTPKKVHDIEAKPLPPIPASKKYVSTSDDSVEHDIEANPLPVPPNTPAVKTPALKLPPKIKTQLNEPISPAKKSPFTVIETSEKSPPAAKKTTGKPKPVVISPISNNNNETISVDTPDVAKKLQYDTPQKYSPSVMRNYSAQELSQTKKEVSIEIQFSSEILDGIHESLKQLKGHKDTDVIDFADSPGTGMTVKAARKKYEELLKNYMDEMNFLAAVYESIETIQRENKSNKGSKQSSESKSLSPQTVEPLPSTALEISSNLVEQAKEKELKERLQKTISPKESPKLGRKDLSQVKEIFSTPQREEEYKKTIKSMAEVEKKKIQAAIDRKFYQVDREIAIPLPNVGVDISADYDIATYMKYADQFELVETNKGRKRVQSNVLKKMQELKVSNLRIRTRI